MEDKTPLQLDNDYTTLAIMLRKACERRNIPFNQTDLNARGWGDLMFAGKTGIHSYEIKKAPEILGSIDHLEGQLLRQMPNCDHMGILIEGRIEQAEDGNCYALTIDEPDFKRFDFPPNSGITRKLKRRYFHMNYLGFRTKLARFYSDHGIEVYEVPDMESLVTQIIALYDVGTTVGHTFSRLIPEKFSIPEKDRARRDFMLTLMGIQGGGVGEELAIAICDWMEEKKADLSLWALMYILDPHQGVIDYEKEFAAAPLRSGKRTIGPAAVAKLKGALGL